MYHFSLKCDIILLKGANKKMKEVLFDKIIQFRNERDWKQFHNELLEVFQWSGNDLMCTHKIDKIKEELADIFIYATLLADCYNLDIDEIVANKISINNNKYPVAKSKGNKNKYNKL